MTEKARPLTEAAKDRVSHADPQAATADGSWMLWTGIGFVGIWVAVVLISAFAPGLVSGSEQEHLPMAAFTTWFWGGIGTPIFLWAMGKLRDSATWRSAWIVLATATLSVWAAATVVGIAGARVRDGERSDADPVRCLLRTGRRRDAHRARGSGDERVPQRSGSGMSSLSVEAILDDGAMGWRRRS